MHRSPGYSPFGSKRITAALQGDPDTVKLVRLVTDIARFRTLLKSAVFDVGGLEFVRAQRQLFGRRRRSDVDLLHDCAAHAV